MTAAASGEHSPMLVKRTIRLGWIALLWIACTLLRLPTGWRTAPPTPLFHAHSTGAYRAGKAAIIAARAYNPYFYGRAHAGWEDNGKFCEPVSYQSGAFFCLLSGARQRLRRCRAPWSVLSASILLFLTSLHNRKANGGLWYHYLKQLRQRTP